jgi:hypothetical protein
MFNSCVLYAWKRRSSAQRKNFSDLESSVAVYFMHGKANPWGRHSQNKGPPQLCLVWAPYNSENVLPLGLYLTL